MVVSTHHPDGAAVSSSALLELPLLGLARVAPVVKNPPAVEEMGVRSLGSKIPWRRAWQPIQHSCLENPMDRGAPQTTAHRVTQSRT